MKSFRRINETEQGIIRNSLGKISNTALSALAKSNNELYISESSSSKRYFYPRVYLLPNSLSEIINRSKSIIYSAGLFFGFIKKGKFLISLEGAFSLHERDGFTEEHQIYVNEKGEKSVLYGNKILKNMILKTPSNLKKNSFVLIFNALNELIAIGQTQVDDETIHNLENDGIVALNLVDKGYYLRKQ